jgi:uncharacterized protein involved in exopolysaccharide biosynthesis
MSTPGDTEHTGLREYALLLWGRKFIVLLVVVVLVGGAVAYSSVVKPRYQGVATLLLTPTLNATLLEANGGLTTQVVDVPSDIQIMQSQAVRSIVERKIPNVPDVTVSQVGVTDVVQVSVQDSSATRAAEAATAYANAYITYEQGQTLNTLTNGAKLLQKHLDTVQLAIANISNEIAGATAATGAVAALQDQLASLNQENAALENQLANYQFFSTNGGSAQSGQLLSSAAVETKPVSPKPVEWTVIAGIIGVLLGIGLAMLLEALSDKSYAY